MIPFVAVVVLLAALAWRLRSPRSAVIPVAVVLLLPPVYAAFVLGTGFDRLDALELRYVGKRVVWGDGIPFTGGGSDPDTAAAEDLYSEILGPGSLRFEPVSAAEAEGAREAAGEDGTGALRRGTPTLRLAGIAPVVSVNGRVLNAVPLQDGDVLAIDPGGGSTLEVELRDDALHVLDGGEGGEAIPLPGALESFLRPGRVSLLPDLLEGVPRGLVLSYLDRGGDGWRAVLRDERVRVLRDGEEIGSLTTPHRLPRAFDLRLQVLRGDVGERRLRTVRQDRVRFFDEYAEVRFGDPELHRVPLAEVGGPLEMGVVVPSSSDRRPRLIELREHSPRFHGLTATLAWDVETEEARLEYLGGGWTAEPGELYGLGEGNDLMLVRVERTRFPWMVLVDLAALSLFLGVFLGPSLARSPALTAVAGTAGLLLADRLLFAWRAATQPPDFFVRGYAEARLALWLVPALLLFGWSVGVLLRQLAARRGDAAAAAPSWRQRFRRAARPLRWPLGGLAVAAVACFLTGGGAGGDLRALALVPVLLGAVLPVLYLLLAGPLAARAGRWEGEGWRWPLWGLAAAGVAWVVVRLGFAALGMPEAIRIPGTGFRLLWTVVQLPLSALLVGLGCHAARRVRAEQPEDARAWLLGVASVVAYLGLAFAVVGVAVRDTGLLLVHGLSVVFALALLLVPPPPRGEGLLRRDWRPAHVVALLLAALPLVGVLGANLMPRQVAAAVDVVRPGDGDAGLTDGVEEDVAARMRGTTQQQLFRLYMLANPDRLRDVGLKPAERVAVQYETLRGYAAAAGVVGEGFHSSRLPRHLGVTYLNDLMPMTFVLADFGKLGMLALALTYLAILLGAVAAFRAAGPASAPGGDPAGDPWSRQGAWITTVALLAFALPGVYMVLANLNLVLFTGKNSTLLALNSVSDVLEAGALLAVAGFGAALARVRPGGVRAAGGRA